MIEILAPAKINLYLHVLKKRTDGYHDIDSLVSFANIGDLISVEESEDFYFHCDGPYANTFTALDRDSSANSQNLVVKAAFSFAKLCGRSPNIRITLTKNIPLSSGLGGGSSDAAATLWALHKLWDIPVVPSNLQDLMTRLGSDVPVCFFSQAARIKNKGEHITPIDIVEECPAILVNPLKPCSTKDVFLNYDQTHTETSSDLLDLPHYFETAEDMTTYLSKQTYNDLTDTAIKQVPDILEILDCISHQKGCKFARMSGSGASCFGLFQSNNEAQNAAESILQDNNHWWTRAVSLGSLERY